MSHESSNTEKNMERKMPSRRGRSSPVPGVCCCCLLLSPADALTATPQSLGKFIANLDARGRQIPCPFFRRRAGEAVEGLVSVVTFIAARHKSILDRPWLPTSDSSLWDELGLDDLLPARPMGTKTCHLPLAVVMRGVERDIVENQYYVSGRLSQQLYDDACYFDSPDPDMPVRSLGRFIDALRGLFDPHRSTIELARMEPHGASAFVAHWRLSGHLKLPWRPAIKPYAGCTLYEVSPDTGLIVSHTEAWSITALDAFVSTIVPSFGAPPALDVSRHVDVEPPPLRLQPPAATGTMEDRRADPNDTTMVGVTGRLSR